MGAREEQLIKAKLGILALVGELKNVARACRLLGISRSQFYAMKSAYEIGGREGLAPRVRRRPVMQNRTPIHMEEQILWKTLEHKTISYLALAARMRAEGINVTPSTIRYVWQWHGLSTARARVRWAKHTRLSSKEKAGINA